jgi:hypothetical protein
MSEATVETFEQEVASTVREAVSPALTERIRERPLVSLGLASLLGFVFGGGAASRTGMATMMLVARIWLRRTATDAVASAITGHGRAKRNVA